MTIRCEIASQDRLVFEGEADIVVLPGIEGEMGILPNHAPLLTTLSLGVIKVRRGTEEEIFTVTGGLAEIQPDVITILADAAENVEELDIARAETARQRAEELLKQGPPSEGLDRYLAIEAALQRSNLRLQAARRYRSGRSRLTNREEKRGDK